MNVVESTQGAEAKSRGNFDNGERGYLRRRDRGNYRSRGCKNFNQGRDNNFGAFNEGRGAGNFGAANQGRGQGNNYQGQVNFNCFNQGKFRHRVTGCRLKQQADVVESQNPSENSNAQQSFFLARHNFEENENIQYLDTGCSNHMCGKNELFSSLEETVKSSVKFGNNANIPILGKGQITIRLEDGSQNFIFDVFYALRLLTTY